MSAPLGPAELVQSLLPFGEGTMLPAQAYTSEDVFVWEQRHFLAGSWFCVGLESELRSGEDVTHRAVVVGGVPVLLVWGPDAPGVEAFANTCRHRGHELLAEGDSGKRRVVVCPYHAWSYALDGSLRTAPGMRDVAGFDRSEHGLVPLPAQAWHGWVFVNADGEGPDLQAHLGGLAGLVEPYAPERLVPLGSHDYEVAANWKVITENYHECYHCSRIHPELCRVSPPDSGANYDLPGTWVGGRMELREHAETMSFDGRSDGRRIDGVDPRSVLYLGLLPNLLLSLHPDYVLTHRLEPLAPGRTRVECQWFFPAADIDPTYAVEFWDRTNRQDWAACESVQRGIGSPHFRPGPLAPNEDAVHRFVTTVARGYLGGKLEG
ncbi:MAG: glycine betaine catabolism [Actinomycetota bacterium]|jgi:Rieske 2Fe-2S family protein|nr:glycine betaine catabolism [Actinomycetota bacterium]